MTSAYGIRGIGIAVALGATLGVVPGTARQIVEPVKKNVDAGDSARRQAFSVVLLVGDMQGGESLDGVPAAARKALADTKDFLPYKNYRLLDSQWTLCCSGTTSVITRLRGLDDQQYELELRASPVFDVKASPALEQGSMSIRFLLRELWESQPGPSKGEPDRTRDPIGKGLAAQSALEARTSQINQELFTLERERTDLNSQTMTLRKQVDIGVKDPAELRRVEEQLALVSRRISALKSELGSVSSVKTSGGPKAVIDTSFRLDVGETVVVGTSGLKGGSRALIALLTAVAKRPK